MRTTCKLSTSPRPSHAAGWSSSRPSSPAGLPLPGDRRQDRRDRRAGARTRDRRRSELHRPVGGSDQRRSPTRGRPRERRLPDQGRPGSRRPGCRAGLQHGRRAVSGHHGQATRPGRCPPVASPSTGHSSASGEHRDRRGGRLVVADLAGIDFIAPDITQPVRETGGGICGSRRRARLPDAHPSHRGRPAVRGQARRRHAVPAGDPEPGSRLSRSPGPTARPPPRG